FAFKSTTGSVAGGSKDELRPLYAQISMKRSISADNGETWAPYEEVQLGEWKPDRPMNLLPMQGIIELKDGTLVGFHGANHPSWQLAGKGGVFELGAFHAAGFSSRSTDQGKTWSAPVPLDGPPGAGMTMDNCEYLSNIQTRNGDLLSLGRPIASPWMWEVWSTNNAVSWGPSTRGPFCMYATAAPSRATASGALVVAGRMPGLAAYISHDDGMSWQGYRIGTDVWAMGSMIEVKPDVLLYVYMDSRGSHARAQFLRVTADGLEPVRDMLPGNK
ncbi:MAG: sialidase family protein, partial [Pirellulales bacterium]